MRGAIRSFGTKVGRLSLYHLKRPILVDHAVVPPGVGTKRRTRSTFPHNHRLFLLPPEPQHDYLFHIFPHNTPTNADSGVPGRRCDLHTALWEDVPSLLLAGREDCVQRA